jgi:hypothetical protein
VHEPGDGEIGLLEAVGDKRDGDGAGMLEGAFAAVAHEWTVGVLDESVGQLDAGEIGRRPVGNKSEKFGSVHKGLLWYEKYKWTK